MNNLNQLQNFLGSQQMRSIMASNNPSAAIQQMLMQDAQSNETLRNIMTSMNNGDSQNAQRILRNIGRQQGIDVDQLVSMLNNILPR